MRVVEFKAKKNHADKFCQFFSCFGKRFAFESRSVCRSISGVKRAFKFTVIRILLRCFEPECNIVCFFAVPSEEIFRVILRKACLARCTGKLWFSS
ncbi:MAG: hypothetical protein CVV41_09205 [Candidatus Riflebacteria bacterium HGW-Riflebacteria-1]|nr:MAG: hypothetical protein CVV41_09205 [Candidatus Riflebacteria bacterium HGW-Riflebacteria-1]